MDNSMMIEKLREQIDSIDNEIMILLKRRFQTIKKLTQHKQQEGEELLQPQREAQILRDKHSKAINMELDEHFVRELFTLILEESEKKEQEFLDKLNSKK